VKNLPADAKKILFTVKKAMALIAKIAGKNILNMSITQWCITLFRHPNKIGFASLTT
jgi:hypothetical protein